MNGAQKIEIYRLELNRLMVVPPTGTAFPDPCTSHIVNAIWEDNNKEGYVMGKTTTEFHLEDCQIDVGKFHLYVRVSPGEIFVRRSKRERVLFAVGP